MISQAQSQIDVMLATSLYDDPAAELHEDASARLREHLALPGACGPCPFGLAARSARRARHGRSAVRKASRQEPHAGTR